MKCFRISTIILVVFCLASAAVSQSDLKISLANSTAPEQQTKVQLERLVKIYDLSKWIMTKTIVIDEKATPHSHPVLTLSARHVKDDELLLATFVHEQMHWFVIEDGRDIDAAIAEFKKMFPDAPKSPPEGARDERSTYLHIAVCYLEYRAMRELIGELRSKQVMEFWTTDHYRWIYRTVIERPRDIGQVMFKYKLIPPEAKSATKPGA